MKLAAADPTSLFVIKIAPIKQMEQQRQHLLLVSYAAQSHINPNLHLCRHLALTAGTSVTFSTTISGFRRMFPASHSLEFHDGLISHIPFSDGYDDRHVRKDSNPPSKPICVDTLSAVIRSLADRGRPVTCIIYTLLISWVGDVARAHSIPSVLFWIQSATVFAIKYHFFHGYDSLVTAHAHEQRYKVNLPGLPPIEIRDLPSAITTFTDPEHPFAALINMLKENFDELDRNAAAGSRVTVLVNTLEELEADALAVDANLKLIPIGPTLSFPLTKGGEQGSGLERDMFVQDEKRYMGWLDSKAEKSVVYVSFGSIAKIKKWQAEKILQGLLASGRPYLWVVRKDNQEEFEGGELEEEGEGMVVEWCSQVRVLSHKAVGCFVTHCGWNSTMETLLCGVPSVAVPVWGDQMMNARLIEKCGIGIRAELDWEGVWEGEELRRCMEVVMGDGERGEEMRRKAATWKEKARRAIADGGSSNQNLKAFLEETEAA